MAYGNYGTEPRDSISSDFYVINQDINASYDYKKDEGVAHGEGIDQVPFGVRINGIIPCALRTTAPSAAAYVSDKGRTGVA